LWADVVVVVVIVVIVVAVLALVVVVVVAHRRIAPMKRSTLSRAPGTPRCAVENGGAFGLRSRLTRAGASAVVSVGILVGIVPPLACLHQRCRYTAWLFEAEAARGTL
jgi:hypothetical protein